VVFVVGGDVVVEATVVVVVVADVVAGVDEESAGLQALRAITAVRATKQRLIEITLLLAPVQYTVQRPRYSRHMKFLNHEAAVADLSTGEGADEATKLRLEWALSLRRLSLEAAESPTLTLGLDDRFDGVGTEGAYQLLFEVGFANIEAEFLHVGAVDG
jgi:hypothetical protein